MRILGHLLETTLFFWEDFLVVGSEVIEDGRIIDLEVDEEAYQVFVDNFGSAAMTFNRRGSPVRYTRGAWKMGFNQDPLEVVIMDTLNDDHTQ